MKIITKRSNIEFLEEFKRTPQEKFFFGLGNNFHRIQITIRIDEGVITCVDVLLVLPCDSIMVALILQDIFSMINYKLSGLIVLHSEAHCIII